jgi:hypothetical protein
LRDNVNITTLNCEIEVGLNILLEYNKIRDPLLLGKFFVFVYMMDLNSALSIDK